MYLTELQLFQILRRKIGESEVEAIVSFVETKLKENNEQNLKVLATKEDIATLRQDMAKMLTEIAENKAEMTKWMFIFWIGTIGVLFGVIIAFINKH